MTAFIISENDFFSSASPSPLVSSIIVYFFDLFSYNRDWLYLDAEFRNMLFSFKDVCDDCQIFYWSGDYGQTFDIIPLLENVLLFFVNDKAIYGNVWGYVITILGTLLIFWFFEKSSSFLSTDTLQSLEFLYYSYSFYSFLYKSSFAKTCLRGFIYVYVALMFRGIGSSCGCYFRRNCFFFKLEYEVSPWGMIFEGDAYSFELAIKLYDV